jgi:hypothetical protein
MVWPGKRSAEEDVYRKGARNEGWEGVKVRAGTTVCVWTGSHKQSLWGFKDEELQGSKIVFH